MKYILLLLLSTSAFSMDAMKISMISEMIEGAIARKTSTGIECYKPFIDPVSKKEDVAKIDCPTSKQFSDYYRDVYSLKLKEIKRKNKMKKLYRSKLKSNVSIREFVSGLMMEVQVLKKKVKKLESK